MIRGLSPRLLRDPVCDQTAVDLQSQDFFYYDKDGFELNLAEQKFYLASGHQLTTYLNHCCLQQKWLASLDDRIIIDHALVLHRCRYQGTAREQLESLKTRWPQAGFLLETRSKWGFDLAIDSVIDGEIFEVIHVEYDSQDFSEFESYLTAFESEVRKRDWADAAQRIWRHRDRWQHLHGFDQNHWKARFLLGWERAEYTEKSL